MAISALLGALAPVLFRRVEGLFRPKQGNEKMAAVIGAIKAILGPLAASGAGPAVPPDSEIRALLEELLSQEKATATWREKGELSAGGKRWEIEIIKEL